MHTVVHETLPPQELLLKVRACRSRLANNNTATAAEEQTATSVRTCTARQHRAPRSVFIGRADSLVVLLELEIPSPSSHTNTRAQQPTSPLPFPRMSRCSSSLVASLHTVALSTHLDQLPFHVSHGIRQAIVDVVVNCHAKKNGREQNVVSDSW